VEEQLSIIHYSEFELAITKQEKYIWFQLTKKNNREKMKDHCLLSLFTLRKLCLTLQQIERLEADPVPQCDIRRMLIPS